MAEKMKIMAAVDLSDYSTAIVRYSTLLARKLDGELLLVNVINQRDLDMVQRAMVGYQAFSFPNYLKDQVRDRETRLQGLLEAVPTGTQNCRYLVQAGIPYRELLSVIESEKPNLLVIGTKGRSNLADVVVGSTSRRMYHRSPIPLLTIPAGFNDSP